MKQGSSQTSTVSQVDLRAIAALFKRIADRGRKIRTQAPDQKNKAPAIKQAGKIHDYHK